MWSSKKGVKLVNINIRMIKIKFRRYRNSIWRWKQTKWEVRRSRPCWYYKQRRGNVESSRTPCTPDCYCARETRTCSTWRKGVCTCRWDVARGETETACEIGCKETKWPLSEASSLLRRSQKAKSFEPK